MCAYCEEQKPLYSYSGISSEGLKSKIEAIVGRKIVTNEVAYGNEGYIRTNTSDFDMHYCPICGRGLTDQTADVQSLREMDKE